jgi:hypothetical protein
MSNPTVKPDAPVFISVSPTNIAIAFGTTVQLIVSLTDVNGNEIEPTEPLRFTSSNTALLTVASSGLCTAVTPDDANVLNVGGIVEIIVTYPFQNRTDSDAISASSSIKVLANSALSAWVPQAPAFDLEWAENHTSGTPHGVGWKVIPR